MWLNLKKRADYQGTQILIGHGLAQDRKLGENDENLSPSSHVTEISVVSTTWSTAHPRRG